MSKPLSEKQLTEMLRKLAGTPRNFWSRRLRKARGNPKYWAVLITRNVRYGHWDWRDVLLELEIAASWSEDWPAIKWRKKNQ